MNPTVILFDVDGTLLTSGGAGRSAMIAAFTHIVGRSDACDSFSMAGMTDRAIIRLGLQSIDEPTADPQIDAILTHYLHLLPSAIASAFHLRACEGNSHTKTL